MNSAERARARADFIREKSRHPEPETLRQQFAAAEFSDFCQCDCNSFKVRIPQSEDIRPLSQPGSAGLFFECDFRLAHRRTLESILFADDNGDLSFVEIDCCGTRCPYRMTWRCRSRPATFIISNRRRAGKTPG